ncbi:type II toxin-antitoxin system antitoxin SocA domain-containing protein [Mesomycoplasma lagogenitalium]|uniref:DUF4065 domain-containing protein n=1 Tax=Mesomycoplasma lagogenitalium TaxID=171286 RepID=A0ABY8LWA0_9BACT|nr:type II toxin-antitoxin system antitoxin SocA domain-containing protein [Mesomycoplasma lagogenitalium]WGI36521.1 DUF4065 domain-containing protein [Mesomycoplasma lagogenitalium]
MNKFKPISALLFFETFLKYCNLKKFKDWNLLTWQQKMLFFTHWAVLKKFDISLFKEEFKAFYFGANILEVYWKQKYTVFKSEDIEKTTESKIKRELSDKFNIEDKIIDYILSVWNKLENLTREELVILAHQLNSWKDIYDENSVGKTITNNKMKEDNLDILEKYLDIK